MFPLAHLLSVHIDFFTPKADIYWNMAVVAEYRILCYIRRVKGLFRVAPRILVKFLEIRTCSVNLGSQETAIIDQTRDA